MPVVMSNDPAFLITDIDHGRPVYPGLSTRLCARARVDARVYADGKSWFNPGSNWRPSVCKTEIITTRPLNPKLVLHLRIHGMCFRYR
jgi:hypothetical protein